MKIEIVGTGHIFEKSVKEVKESIYEKKPDILALELDKDRFCGLMNKFSCYEGDRKNWWYLMRKGRGGSFLVLSFLLEKIQRRLGEKLGVFPGSEMIAAIDSVRENECEIVLIDRNIKISMNHLLRIPLKEKINLLRLRKIRKKELELDNLEDLLEDGVVEKVISEIKRRLPYTYNALVDERDKFMSYNLFQLQKQYPQKKILAVVGIGHKKGIEKYLKLIEEKDVKINLEKILEEKIVSIFQFISLFFIIFLGVIMIEINFRIK